MRRIYIYMFCLTAALCVSSCMDKYREELMLNSPIYLDYTTLRSSVKPMEARNLVHPGKICFKDRYLLVVEYQEGVHVIDVSDPKNPQNKVFIEIPGCIDIAIKDNALYADSYVDLVTIDLSDMNRPKEKNRLKDVFPYTLPSPENGQLPYASIDQEKGVVIAWEIKHEKRDLERRYYPSYPIYNNYYLSDKGTYSTASSGVTTFGKNGSMARFGLYDRYLYIVNSYMLYIFDVKNADAPVKAGVQSAGGNIETLFAYDNHLFFGTPSGMLVYSLRIPSMPEYVGNFWHITSCDPVVVQDGYAYITLRGGTNCQNSGFNRLDIIECSDDYKQFNLVDSYDMTEPYGLGIDNNLLFICDGSAGLKVFDVTNKARINQLASFPNIQTYDVIPVNDYLFMIGNDGFYLYDYSDIHSIHQIGHIPVVNE